MAVGIIAIASTGFVAESDGNLSDSDGFPLSIYLQPGLVTQIEQ